jgi:hypothetical protein
MIASLGYITKLDSFKKKKTQNIVLKKHSPFDKEEAAGEPKKLKIKKNKLEGSKKYCYRPSPDSIYISFLLMGTRHKGFFIFWT